MERTIHMKNKLIKWISLFLISSFMLVTFPVYNKSYAAEWRVLPIRSEAEFELGMIGGEGEQYCQGAARSLSNPDIIYLSHDIGQVWRSDNGGDSWAKTMNQDLYVGAGQSIEVDPVNSDSVFLIANHSWDIEHTDYNGVYHSTDGGDTWEFVLPATTMNSRWYEHNTAFDPASVTGNGAARWYAAIHSNNLGSDDGLYRSDDSGETWTCVGDLPGTNKRFYQIQAHPSDGQTVYAATNLGLYASSSRGANLAPLGNLPAGTVTSIAVNPDNGNIIYAVVQNNGLYKSINGGTTFILLRANTSATHVFINPGFPDVVYFTGASTSTATQRSVVSRDGGQTWVNISMNPPLGLAREWKTTMGGNMTTILPDPEDIDDAIGLTNAHLWKTTNAAYWYSNANLFTGYNVQYPRGVIFDRSNPDRFVTCNADIGVCITDNGGDWFYNVGVPKPWRSSPQSYIPWTSMATAALQPGTNIIISAAGDTFNKRLVRSDVSDWSGYNKDINSQDYWQIYDLANNFANNPLKNYWFIEFHPNDTNKVFTESKKSADAGVTWTDMPFLTQNSASIIGMCASQPGDPNPFFTLYAVNSSRNEIFRSDDEGATWYSYVQTAWLMRGHDSKPIIAVHPANPDIIYALDAEKDISMYDGQSWTSLGIRDAAVDPNGPVNYPRAFVIDPRHPEVMYAGMCLWGGETVWRSVDSGATWENVTRNLPRLAVGGLSINPHTGELFRGNVDGTYVLPPPYDEVNELVYDKCVNPAEYGTSPEPTATPTATVTPVPTPTPVPQSNITLTVPESVYAWQYFTVTVGIETQDQVQNVDLEILSNNDLVLYREYQEVDGGLNVTGVFRRHTQGTVRLILGGTEGTITGTTQLVNLTFQARGQALTDFSCIKLTQATLVDVQGNTISPDLPDVIVPVVLTGDLNRDGFLSVVDLQVISEHYGKDSTSPDWATASVADVNGDLAVNMSDMTLETTYILQW
jgi:photosystem II stability/assembly factor-like uncharacterized protein